MEKSRVQKNNYVTFYGRKEGNKNIDKYFHICARVNTRKVVQKLVRFISYSIQVGTVWNGREQELSSRDGERDTFVKVSFCVGLTFEPY